MAKAKTTKPKTVAPKKAELPKTTKPKTVAPKKAELPKTETADKYARLRALALRNPGIYQRMYEKRSGEKLY